MAAIFSLSRLSGLVVETRYDSDSVAICRRHAEVDFTSSVDCRRDDALATCPGGVAAVAVVGIQLTLTQVGQATNFRIPMCSS